MGDKIKVKDYYNQIKMIGHEEGDNAFNKLTIKDTTGTFQLINEIIRDLVHIKNEVKKNRDSEIIGTSAPANAGEDEIELNTTATTINGVRQASVWASFTGSANRGITTNAADIKKVPAIYKNDEGGTTTVGYLSEAALFLALKKVCTNLKTIRYRSTTEIVNLDSTHLKKEE